MDNCVIPQGYKATALGIIPQEWEIFDFDEIVEKSKERYIPNPDAHLYCIELEHLSQGEGTLIGYTDSAEQKSTKNRFQNGNVLFGKLRPYLQKYWLATFDGVCSTEIWVFHAKPNICLKEYLLRIISSYNFIQKANVSSGSKMPRAEWDYVSKIPVLVPPLAEQRKIAEVLGVWDEAIEKQARLIEKLALRKRALMQRLLSAKLRLPGFSEPWQKVKLGDIGDTYNGLSGKNKDDFEYGNAQFIPYINVFSNERIDTNNLGCVQIKPNEQQNTVKYGDIFFTVSSETPDEVGMASVLLEHLDNTYLNSFCFGYRLNNFSTLNPFFAAYLFRTEHFRNYMSVLAQGSTRFNISKKEVMKLKIDLPTIEEQTAIAEVLTAADREIELAKEKLERLRRQKRGLMQQLLTGKKRVKC